MIFGSDNLSGASAKVLEGLQNAYSNPNVSAYGTDDYSKAAEQKLSEVFETELRAFFVVSGTAANTLALSTLVKPWEGVICHHQAHILLDESSGPALVTGGASLLPVPSRALKVEPMALESMLARLPNEPPHNIRPAALSISQANEGGQIYSVEEVTNLCDVAKKHALGVHMDGARFSNAVEKLNCRPADITWKAGVDILCLGATKNGALAAEAIIFFNTSLAEDFDYQLKRTGHLVSKGRLFGAQFLAWLDENHWLELAANANSMADELRRRIAALNGIRLAFESTSNETFIVLDKKHFEALLKKGISMYDWYLDSLPEHILLAENEVLARLVTSFATSHDHIDAFEAAVKDIVG